VVAITVACCSWAPRSGDHLLTCGPISRPSQLQNENVGLGLDCKKFNTSRQQRWADINFLTPVSYPKNLSALIRDERTVKFFSPHPILIRENWNRSSPVPQSFCKSSVLPSPDPPKWNRVFLFCFIKQKHCWSYWRIMFNAGRQQCWKRSGFQGALHFCGDLAILWGSCHFDKNSIDLYSCVSYCCLGGIGLVW